MLHGAGLLRFTLGNVELKIVNRAFFSVVTLFFYRKRFLNFTVIFIRCYTKRGCAFFTASFLSVAKAIVLLPKAYIINHRQFISFHNDEIQDQALMICMVLPWFPLELLINPSTKKTKYFIFLDYIYFLREFKELICW